MGFSRWCFRGGNGIYGAMVTSMNERGYYEEWERLRKREREEIRRAGRLQTDSAWARWREAARKLREHENAFERDFVENTCK